MSQSPHTSTPCSQPHTAIAQGVKRVSHCSSQCRCFCQPMFIILREGGIAVVRNRAQLETERRQASESTLEWSSSWSPLQKHDVYYSLIYNLFLSFRHRTLVLSQWGAGPLYRPRRRQSRCPPLPIAPHRVTDRAADSNRPLDSHCRFTKQRNPRAAKLSQQRRRRQ